MAGYTYLRSAGQIAAGLRALADDIDAAGLGELPEVAVLLDLQVLEDAAPPGERIGAVDALAAALGTVADTARLRTSEGFHHCTPHDAERHGIRVSAFTALNELEQSGEGRAV